MSGRCGLLMAIVLLAVAPSSVTLAQTLRFSNHRDVKIPEYAVLRIGSFYSSVSFSQAVGYRYTSGNGDGIDYLFQNQRGVFLKDGSDFPLVSTLDMRNYLIISPTTDLDISLRASYAYFPLKTQEDEFIFDLAQEGLVGNLSMEFELTPYVKGTAFNYANYKTDYIDTRGLNDRYGGEAYEHFSNSAGVNLDWLMAKDQNMALSLGRRDVLPRADKFKDQQSVSYDESLNYQQLVNPMIMAGAGATFSQISYTGSGVSNRPATSFQTYSVFSTARLTERTTGNAMIGYSKASFSMPESPAGGGGDGNGVVIGSASINTELDRGLNHVISFARSQVAGYNSPVQINDAFGYHLNWASEDKVTAGLFTDYNISKPSEAWMGEYSDWSSGVNASLPLSRAISLVFDSTYSVRSNKGVTDPQVKDLEWLNNYNTWSSRIGTSFGITREVDFTTYLQHIDRSSDSDVLKYSRNVFAATFTYTHQF